MKKIIDGAVLGLMWMAVVLYVMLRWFAGDPPVEQAAKEPRSLATETGYIAGVDLTGLKNLPEPAEVVLAAAPNTPEPVQAAPQEDISLGVFTITHYCGCRKCCGKSDGITATGTRAVAGRTIAVDPDVIPLGSWVVIGGKEYVAEDTGQAIRGRRIDIFCDSHREALERGIFEVDVQKRGAREAATPTGQ